MATTMVEFNASSNASKESHLPDCTLLCDPTTSASFANLAQLGPTSTTVKESTTVDASMAGGGGVAVDGTTTTTVGRRVPQDVLYPAYTNDYRVVHGMCGGLGLVANRFIAKGEIVLMDSIEFLFADVQEGDNIILVGHEMASVESETTVPERVPITRDMLIRTHGVPVLAEDPKDPESAGIEFYRLEVPWMLQNHSCDPNVVDSSHKEPEGEAIAARDIQRGEELTYDYTHQYYDKDLHSFECLCGASNCRKFVTGFAGLSDEDKVRLWPHVSDYIKVRHFADMGTGPKTKVEYPVLPDRAIPADDKQAPVMRLVVPGPSCAASEVAIRKNNEGEYRLFALQDFAPGDKVYSYWNFIWPDQGRNPIDMVAASNLLEGDVPEGTVIRVNPLEHGVRDSMGRIRFSGYDMLTEHSCDPNLVYNYKDEDEEDDWRCAYATRTIKKGEVLTIDFNTVWWDRSQVVEPNQACNCGATNCRGTVAGFAHLSKKQQEELKSMSWLRVPMTSNPPAAAAGQALSPYIHACRRKDCNVVLTDGTDYSVSSSNVSSSFEGHSSSDEE